MTSEGRIGLPAAVDDLISRHVDDLVAELQRRYSRALAQNPPGTAIMAKVLRRATVSGVMAQLDADGNFVGHLRGAGPHTWEEWQAARRETAEGSEWPARLSQAAPAAVERGAGSVASAGAEVGLRERRPGEVRRIGEQAVEAGGALARGLTGC